MNMSKVSPDMIVAWGVTEERLDEIENVTNLCSIGWHVGAMTKPEIVDRIDKEFPDKRDAIICAMATAHLMTVRSQ
jgi:hypothetical protein